MVKFMVGTLYLIRHCLLASLNSFTLNAAPCGPQNLSPWFTGVSNPLCWALSASSDGQCAADEGRVALWGRHATVIYVHV